MQCVLEKEGDILFSSFCLTLLTSRSHCAQPCLGRRENSPSNKQRTTRLHPGKRWCRNTESSENRARSVSIYAAPWAFTVCVPFSTWPGLLFSSTQATTLEVCFQKCLLSCLLWALREIAINRRYNPIHVPQIYIKHTTTAVRWRSCEDNQNLILTVCKFL